MLNPLAEGRFEQLQLANSIASSSSHATTYRPEIDGLRAVAVLSVVGYHAFPTLLPGGFIGVDIFFVISGYLISQIIFKGIDENSFSYSDFYSRRIRRIFPALSLVLAACLLAGVIFLFPTALSQLGLHTAAGAAFLSNILLWTESGYFDGASASKPLLHLWSLGIEEQYYLVWPLLLGLMGARLKWRLGALMLVIIASFTLNLLIVASNPVADFYLPFSRFWELLVGSLLAYVSLYTRASVRIPPRPRPSILNRSLVYDLLAWTGASAILVGLVILRSDQPFPGSRALIPAFGAAFLIAGGSKAWLNRNILAARWPVFFGLISYPLYLWHWPMLVFPSVINGSASRMSRVLAVAASIVCAWASYKLVESPIRRGGRRRNVTIGLAVSVGVLGVCGLGLFWSNGLPQRYPSVLRNVALSDQYLRSSEYRERGCFLQKDQGPSEFLDTCVQARGYTEQPLILIWGDSHAASLYPGFRSLLDKQHSRYRLGQFTSSACPPVIGFVVSARPSCRANNDFVLKYIREQRPDTVVMLASWSFYTGADFEKLDLMEIRRTADTLRAAGVANIYVLGPLPRWTEHQPNVVLREWSRTHSVVFRSNDRLDPTIAAFDENIKIALQGSPGSYLSPFHILCDARGCPILTERSGQLFPMAWDDAHLTVQGSEDLAADLFGLMQH